MNKNGIWFAVLAATLAVVCACFARTTSAAPFYYDESDYMYASKLGFTANYVDRGALSIQTYIEKGTELLHDRTQRAAISQYIRSSNDAGFYRHYHGPVYVFWLILCDTVGVHSEKAFRASGLILNVIEAFLIYFGFLKIFPDLSVEAAFLAGAVFALNRTMLVTGTAITQHVVFALAACAALFAMSEFLKTRRDRWWYIAAALAGVSFAAVEISVVLVGVMVLLLIGFERARGFRTLAAMIGKGILCFLGAVVVIWPAGIYKLGAIRGYLYLAYIAVARKTFTPIGPVELWEQKITAYPLEFVLLLAAMVVGLAWLWR